MVSGAGTTTLAYDYEGRIATITYPSTATNTFAYNGLDTRVSKVDSAGTSTYKRDGAGVTAPVLGDGAAVYTPGISERRSSTTTFLHSGLKNADSQSGTSQTVGATKQYDAFGNVTASTGTWKGPFGYAGSFGYQEDADSSLKLLGHRYYDPSTGRFLTRDPIKNGRNWYVYCHGNPVSYSDPRGLRRGTGLYSPENQVQLQLLLIEVTVGEEIIIGAAGATLTIWDITKIMALLAAPLLALLTPAVSSSDEPELPGGRPIWRVTGRAESDSLRRNGGVATPSPYQDFEKPYWTSQRNAEVYKGLADRTWGEDHEIWFWPNPAGVGAPGPPMDGADTWLVPPQDLPLVGPGTRVR